MPEGFLLLFLTKNRQIKDRRTEKSSIDGWTDGWMYRRTDGRKTHRRADAKKIDPLGSILLLFWRCGLFAGQSRDYPNIVLKNMALTLTEDLIRNRVSLQHDNLGNSETM